MFSKKTNRNLGIIFGILAIIVLIMIFSDAGKEERTFRDVLVRIDTAAVSEIYLYPKSQDHEEVRLFNEEGEWRVALEEGKSAAVPDNKITNMFNQLLSIKPKRLAARDAAKWGEYQVDSTGTRIKVMEGNSKTLDIILGRFSFQQPRSMSTYVRLENDTDVYEVDGFLEMTFNQKAESFRDGSVINSDYNDFERLTFIYPADSSFQIDNVNGDWVAGGEPLDSAKTVDYLRKLGRTNSTAFLDNVAEDDLVYPTYKLRIDRKDTTVVEVNAYVDSTKYVITSSQNPESYFDGSKNNLGDKIFIGLKSLLKED